MEKRRASKPLDKPILPLPPGFQHTVKVTTGKPEGYVQYVITCPAHGEKLADRIRIISDFFNTHSHCRWNLLLPDLADPWGKDGGRGRRRRKIMAVSGVGVAETGKEVSRGGGIWAGNSYLKSHSSNNRALASTSFEQVHAAVQIWGIEAEVSRFRCSQLWLKRESLTEYEIACREEWNCFARNLGEVQEDYLERLRETFCFKKDIPPNGTSIRIQGIEVPPPLLTGLPGRPSPKFLSCFASSNSTSGWSLMRQESCVWLRQVAQALSATARTCLRRRP